MVTTRSEPWYEHRWHQRHQDVSVWHTSDSASRVAASFTRKHLSLMLNLGCWSRSTLRFHSPPGVYSDLSLRVMFWAPAPCPTKWSAAAMVTADLWPLPACILLGLQFPQDLVVMPPVPTLSQCRLTTEQDVLQAWVWGIAELTVFFGAIPLAQFEKA